MVSVHSPQKSTMPDCLTTRRPDVLGGTPVFAGTRVPVRYLFDWLEGGGKI